MVGHESSYPGTREEQALAWVEDVSGMNFDGDELGMALHNGVALCELANKLAPGAVRKISHSRMPFPQRENIAAFIEAARLMGVPEHELFETSDLYEQSNIKSVVNCLFEVGQVAYSLPDYDGPALGTPPTRQHTTRHHSAAKMDALWGHGGSKFGQADAATRTDKARASGGPSIAAATAAGRKIQVEHNARLDAFHRLDASEQARKAVVHRNAPQEVDSNWHAKMPKKAAPAIPKGKVKKTGPPAIPKGRVKKHHPPVPHRKTAPAPGEHDYDADRAASEAQIHAMLTHNQEEQRLLATHDELAALRALKDDHTAKDAAEEAAADYSKYSKPDFDVHTELLSVQSEVAALRDELEVKESTVWAAGEAKPEDRNFVVPVPTGGLAKFRQMEASGNFYDPPRKSAPEFPKARAPITAAEEAAALLATQDQALVDNAYQLLDADGKFMSRKDAASQPSQSVSRPRQQSATAKNRNRSRSKSMSAPPPVIVDEHIPHVAVGGGLNEDDAMHEIKTQEVAEGVFLHTYQNTGGPPLLVTYRIETKIDDAVQVAMSFDGSENIGVLPESGDGQLSASRLIPPHAQKTLICSVRQVDKYSPARVAMSMDMQFSSQ